MFDNLLVNEAGIKTHADHPVTDEERAAYQADFAALAAQHEGEEWAPGSQWAEEQHLLREKYGVLFTSFDPDAADED